MRFGDWKQLLTSTTNNLHAYLTYNSMEQGHSWEANSSSVLQEISRILWYPKFNPYPTAFPYGNGMVLHFYQQQESSKTKTVHRVINKGLKTYV